MGGRVGGIAVQTVAIEHDEYLFLRIAVDAANGNVDVVITVDEVWISGNHSVCS